MATSSDAESDLASATLASPPASANPRSPSSNSRSPSSNSRARVQTALPFPPGRGGARRGAGRKPTKPRIGNRPWVRHLTRRGINRSTPLLVTVTFRRELGYLRKHHFHRALRHALALANGRFGVRFCEYSLQGDHCHLMVEPPDASSLARAMTGLGVRLAAGFRRITGRRGGAIRDRYHHRPLTRPKQVRNALAYLLHNCRKHAGSRHRERYRSTYVDPFSSAAHFSGWNRAALRFLPRISERPATEEPKTWLLRVGWRRHGLISLSEWPASTK